MWFNTYHEAPHLVVDVAVSEHGVEILHTFTCAPIVVVLQSFLDGSQVHGSFYYRMIILGKKKRVNVTEMGVVLLYVIVPPLHSTLKASPIPVWYNLD